MNYEIKRFQGGETIATEVAKGWSFETIKTDARNWVEMNLADRVEVFDMGGRLVHHFPRVMRAANR